jgi:hypothetical protein
MPSLDRPEDNYPELTPERFRPAVMGVLADAARRKRIPELEEHLRALWAQIVLHRDCEPSFGLFAQLIRRALEAPPAEFRYEWLKVEPPHWLLYDGGYLIEARDESTGATAFRKAGDFEVLRLVLMSQIADLNRIRIRQPDPNSGFAIVSPTKQQWYNVDVHSYWECATAGLEGKLPNPNHRHRFLSHDWATLAFLLELGQSYE